MEDQWLVQPPLLAETSAATASHGRGDAAVRAAATQWVLFTRHVPQVLGTGCKLITMRKPEPNRLHGEVRALLESDLIAGHRGEAYLQALGALSAPARLPRSVCLDAAGRSVSSAPTEDTGMNSWASAMKQCTVTSYDYWDTVGGTPAAFVRPWELVGEIVSGAVGGIIDFGYGSIGQLQALASLGFTCTGIEASRGLHALYSPDSALVRLLYDDATGPLLRYLASQEPGKASVFISKNTLKKGYVNPDPPHQRVMALGVSDSQFLSSVHKALCPGGMAMIYNIHPSMKPPYRSWADGRCPYTVGQCEDAGFRVVAHDADDTAFAIAMGKALGWGDQMDVDGDLFATYTLLQRPLQQSSL